ncbi:hypothetical protein HS041_28000 [Planomonospora sp. ID67723]|uniref:hypothetical protein n=1 Tax=Planomonospora sp. ID67723 TaxID=2738134 RepID=UPI0018C36EB6|nr:hypothetical protein [Planomonospora sp. ID67723]MBG0831581.1 hypothetical protein [Planomonospora sp. ID67723]
MTHQHQEPKERNAIHWNHHRSNGAHLRVRHRHSWWLRCPCGLYEVVESARAAKARKAEHDTPSARISGRW